MFLTGFSLDSPGVGALILLVALLVFVAFYYFKSNGRGAKDVTAKAAPVAAPVPAIDEESYAVLLAAIKEEARLSGEEIRVVSIREL
ncbi:MAG: hypothetical protein IJ374_12945 [Lachnospiraceae bacterium]|nr:hypothetical protein [Lachnospiraceae bacterium]